jgi:4-diphosphocytidyl-2-C-methyl-D-erythritol kinase
MLTLKAYAKINWFLKVFGRRNDGYHEICSLIHKVGLHDILYLKPSDDLTLSSDIQIPTEDNLVYRAAKLLQEKSGIRSGAEIRLKKNIPQSAGLGGGSSDAASTLAGLNELWSLKLSSGELLLLAGQLGSDVPFFLGSPLSLAEGRGEKLTHYSVSVPFSILLVNPGINISTRWAYDKLHSVRMHGIGTDLTKHIDNADNIQLFIHSVQKGEIDGNTCFRNDFESALIEDFPAIGEIKESLLREGATLSMMSGSGSTLFGVFDSMKEAENASGKFRNYWTSVIQTLTDNVTS